MFISSFAPLFCRIPKLGLQREFSGGLKPSAAAQITCWPSTAPQYRWLGRPAGLLRGEGSACSPVAVEARTQWGLERILMWTGRLVALGHPNHRLELWYNGLSDDDERKDKPPDTTIIKARHNFKSRGKSFQKTEIRILEGNYFRNENRIITIIMLIFRKNER